jgi:hypothetical protein
MHKLLFPAFVLLLLQACRFKEKPAPAAVKTDAYAPYQRQIDEGQALLKEGDLVLRNGNDLTSQFIKNFSKKDKSYSHSGLVFYKGNTPFVYHILATEGNDRSELVADSLATFCDPRHNSAFAIYRYNMEADELANLKASVLSWHKKGVQFDSVFNLKTDDRMYCSEMIKKGLEKATSGRIAFPTIRPNQSEAVLAATRIPLTAGAIEQLEIVPIDNLYMHPHCRLVQRFEFNPAK